MRVGGPRLFPELAKLISATSRGLRPRNASALPKLHPSLYSTSHDRAAPDFAFAFDIDGVLLRSSTPIPGAAEALKRLQRDRVSFILLTNGGGKHESERIADINAKLDIKLDSSMIVQSHTPFARLVHPTKEHPEGLKDKCVLVLGGNHGRCRAVANAYGFNNVINTGDLFSAYPEIWPFSKVFSDYYKQFALPLPKPINPSSPEDSLKIDAVFVFNDPRDWALDLQVIMDVLLSQNGIMGTYSPKNGDRSLPNNGYLQDGQPKLYFSNADLLWAAGYHLNRLAQGGFQEALEGVWAAVTGGPREGAKLAKTVIGKPFKETYDFAEDRLISNHGAVLGNGADAVPLKRVYMIGDNPESDIRGANTYQSPRGIEWISLLTRTGVWHEGPGKTPSWAPRETVDDVAAAVEWALNHSRWEGAGK